MTYLVGVDVGTQSARAGVFDISGALLATAEDGIRLHRPQAGWVEQSSPDIWRAVCVSVREALSLAGVAGAEVGALSFDAACSLVLAERTGEALPLSDDWDVLVWMDQRATEEARVCTATGARPLAFIGGAMSPEMQVPKLMWLKHHRPDLWTRLGYAGDLADYLSWRATGETARSICTLTCKWGYVPSDTPGWNAEFLRAVGLEDLRARAALPERATPVGLPVGSLTEGAAQELGLTRDCIVAAGLIDAHAGALASFAGVDRQAAPGMMALVAGTSNCQMALHPQAQSIRGVWGPYQDVVLPGLWLSEGGQTATGALLDHLVEIHHGARAFAPDVHAELSKHLTGEVLRDGDPAPGLHVLPDFIGNRSPHADPTIRGAIWGLTFDAPEVGFAKLYWAACCAIAYGARSVIERLNSNGYRIERVILSGGHVKSDLLRMIYADALGTELEVLTCDEPMLQGAAMAARAGLDRRPLDQTAEMMAARRIPIPPDPGRRKMHERRYQAFQKLYARS